MLYIVVKQENYPDRIIEDVFGPFETEDAACAFAESMERHGDNYSYQHRLFNYLVRCLISPNAYVTGSQQGCIKEIKMSDCNSAPHVHVDEQGFIVKCYHKCKGILTQPAFWFGVTLTFPIEHFLWTKVPGFSHISEWLGLFTH